MEYTTNSRPMSNSELKLTLNTKEVKDLVLWFIESYDDGWRPEAHSPTHMKDLRDHVGQLIKWQNED